MESFYVHLQSDASANHFPSNRRVNYRNHLAVPININSAQYEVALTELSYTYNKPFISKQTILYKIYRLGGVPKVTQYPGAFDVIGQRRHNYTIWKNVLDYAKKNMIHVEEAEETFKISNLPLGNQRMMLIREEMDITAPNDINTTDQLVKLLNDKLNKLDVEVIVQDATRMVTLADELPDDPSDPPTNAEYDTNLDAEVSVYIKEIRIIQKKPWLIADRQIDILGKAHDHFQMSTQDEHFYDKQNKTYNSISVVSKNPLDIKKGDPIASVIFFRGEIHIAAKYYRGEQISNDVMLIAETPNDLKNVDELVTAVNRPLPTIKFVITNNRAKLTAQLPFSAKVEFNERLLAILGLDIDSTVLLPKDEIVTIEGTQNVHFELGSKKIYVYTDIIEEQRLGDQVAPILRITEYTGTQDNLEIKDFNQLHYIRPNKDFIDSIRIYLKTETGEDLPLTFGTSSCTIHVRERRF